MAVHLLCPLVAALALAAQPPTTPPPNGAPSASAPAPKPAAPPAQPAAHPIALQPWSRADAKLLGPAAAVLQKSPTFIAPQASFPLSPLLGQAWMVLASPDAKTLFVYALADAGDRLWQLDITKGGPTGEPIVFQGTEPQVWLLRCGPNLVMRRGGGPIIFIDAAANKQLSSITPPGSDAIAADATGEHVATLTGSLLMAWDTHTGRVSSRVPVPWAANKRAYLAALPAPGLALLVSTTRDMLSAAVVNLKTGSLVKEILLDSRMVSVAGDQRTFAVGVPARSAPVFERLNVFDAATLAPLAPLGIAPALNIVSARVPTTSAAAPAALFCLQEERSQALLVLDARAGAITGVFGPDGCSCVSLDFAPDGHAAYAIAGPWDRGIVHADRLLTYTLALAAPAPAAPPAKDHTP